MRNTWLALAILAGVAVAGCGSDDAMHGGAGDMAVPDLGHGGGDLAAPTACNPTDPMNDGSSCSAPGGCPMGTIGVNLGGPCKCYTKCTMNEECSCNRLCDPVSLNDAGAGAACLPGNAPGTRCGRDTSTGQGFGNIFCGQLTVCVNADPARIYRYCNYKCNSQTDCPAQTTCQPLMDTQGNVIGNVCAYNSGANGNKNAGDACTFSDVCKTGLLCSAATGGTCQTQCDGPGGTCATGTCTAVDDPASGKVIGYVCK
jgi:hypothetical protein